MPSLPPGFRYYFVTAVHSDHTSIPTVLIACPTSLPDKMLSFASNIRKVFVESCHEDQWNLLTVESPEVEKKQEKLKSKEGDDDADSNDGDEESSGVVEDDVAEFDLRDLSVRYWAFLLLNLASCKTTVCVFFFPSLFNFFRPPSKLFLPLSLGNPYWHSFTLFLRLEIWDIPSLIRPFSLLLTKMTSCLVSFFC